MLRIFVGSSSAIAAEAIAKLSLPINIKIIIAPPSRKLSFPISVPFLSQFEKRKAAETCRGEFPGLGAFVGYCSRLFLLNVIIANALFGGCDRLVTRLRLSALSRL